MNALTLSALALGLSCAAPAASIASPGPAATPTQESRQARGWLGVSLREQGGKVAVSDMQAGSPAERAGMRVGDRILSVEGHRLESYAELSGVLGHFAPGDTVTLAVGREIEVELGLHPEAGSTWLGVTLNADDEGVEFTSVVGGSPADSSGLSAGDRVLAIAGSEVRTAQEAIDRIRDHQPGDRIGIIVRRGIDVRLGRNDRQSAERSPRADRPERPERRKRAERPGKDAQAGRGYLGIQISGDEVEAPVVTGKVEGGPADKGGLEVGERIVSIDGRRTEHVADVFEILEATQPGDRVKVTVIGPEGEDESHTIRLGRRDRLFPEGEGQFSIPGVDREHWEHFQNELHEGMEKLHHEWRDNQESFRGKWHQLRDEAQRRAHEWREQHPDWPEFEFRAPQFLAPDHHSEDEVHALRKELEELRAELRDLRAQLRELLR